MAFYSYSKRPQKLPCKKISILVLRSGVAILQFARTECINDTLNPDFVRKFIVEYRFEEQQKLKFVV